ncbi:MAG TPA: hypothetical protein VFS43_41390 [Polyangiaceae bacterium]|nr:hypothetical protein [Polyangiaceae bacterium]
MNDKPDPPPPLPPGVLVVRPGRGANCSSIGSVVDVLFGAGVVGGALIVAVTAWLEGQEGPGGGPEPGGRGAPGEGAAGGAVGRGEAASGGGGEGAAGRRVGGNAVQEGEGGAGAA